MLIGSGQNGIRGTDDDLGTFYESGYDSGAGGTNAITAVDDLAAFTFSFTCTGTWNGQCEFFVDGSKYNRGTAEAPGYWVGDFWGGHSSWSVDATGGLTGNTGTSWLYNWRSRIKHIPLSFR